MAFLERTGNFLFNIQPFYLTENLTYPKGEVILNSDLQPSAFPIYQRYCEDGFVAKDDCATQIGKKFYMGHVSSDTVLFFHLSEYFTLNLTFGEILFISGSTNFAGGVVPVTLVFC